MNIKNKIIKFLVDLGKKNKLLVYPSLALVAIISAISHLVYWGRGNGKKLVASVLVMVMLITQSFFLTSSANETGEITEESVDLSTSEDEPEVIGDLIVNLYLDGSPVTSSSVSYNSGDDTYTYNASGTDVYGLFGKDSTYSQLFSIDGLHRNSDYSDGSISGALVINREELNDGAGNYGSSINLYAKSERIAYRINFNSTIGSNFTELVSVDSSNGEGTPTATYTVKTASDYNLYQYGYNYSGINIGGTSYAVGTSVVLSSDIEANIEKQPMKYNVTYSLGDADILSHLQFKDGDISGIKAIEYTYSPTIGLMNQATVDNWVTWEGYVFAGWNDGSTNYYDLSSTFNSSSFYTEKDNIEEDPNIEGITLTAIWTYKNVKLNAVPTNDKLKVTSEGNKITLNGQYGDDVGATFKPEYVVAGDASNFNCSISSADIQQLQEFGFDVTPVVKDGMTTSYKIAGSLTDTGSITFNYVVVDNNVLAGENNTFTFEVTLNSNKRQVTIDSASIKDSDNKREPFKTYNGEVGIALNNTANLNNLFVEDNVIAEFDSSAVLSDANAGKNKTITLKNVVLVGDNADNYYIEYADASAKTIVIENIATVEQATIVLDVSLSDGQSDQIKFGEDTPKYTMRVKDTTLLSSADLGIYNGLSTDSQYEGFMTTYLGFNQWKTDRELYSDPKTYSIIAEFDSTGKNYRVDASIINQSFNVSRDTSNNKVEMSGELNNGYYKGLTIKSNDSKYTMIRQVTNGDINTSYTREQAAALFSNSASIGDTTGTEFSYQLYDPLTGAISSISTIKDIKVDTVSPAYTNINIAPINTYFNQFSFGSYYHSQNIDGSLVERVQIDLEFFDNNSSCDQLHYYFADESGNNKETINGVANFTNNPNVNTGKATIYVGTGSSGQIIVWATDKAGNESEKKKIVFDGLTDDSSYYEWMVENSISSSPIVVTDASGANAVPNAWYNSLNIISTANDSESGLNKLVWTITKPDGTSVEIEETAGASFANVINQASYGKIYDYVFSTLLSGENVEPGAYTISGVLYDNAGNKVKLEDAGPFYFDGKAPEIVNNTVINNDKYKTDVDIVFDVSEGSEESGVASVELFKSENGNEIRLKLFAVGEDYSYTATENGTYIIRAYDKAGNVAEEIVTLSKISSGIPNDPVVNVDGTLGKDNWYVDKDPSINIKSSHELEDGTPVTTYYKIQTGTTSSTNPVSSDDYSIDLMAQGEVIIDVWSVSASGKESQHITLPLKIDTTKPILTMLESTKDSSGKVNVNFRIDDTHSGIKSDEVLVNGNKCSVKESGGYYLGSFVVGENKVYKITAQDVAGNISDELEFSPLYMKANPVIDITKDEAYISAQIIEGTYELDSYYIEVKTKSDSYYERCLTNIDTDGNMIDINTSLKNLKSDTIYNYRIYAISKISKEECIFEGSFKTLSENATASIKGNVIYGSEIDSQFITYPIYVSLFSGNTYVAGMTLNSDEEQDYLFRNISDGSYQIKVTNGILSLTESVEVKDGGISYPSNYGSLGGINFVLNGLSTDVVVLSDYNITISGLNDIYDVSLYKGNITDEDLEVVKAGGNINITLYARVVNVGDINSTEMSILYDKIGENGVILKYIDIYIIKEVRDINNNLVNGTPSNIRRLAESIRITFPLDELVGEKLYVAMVHEESDNNYMFKSWEETSISGGNYVTISTDRFSTYALYKKVEVQNEYTVKFFDGNGEIIKEEKVLEGESATPPTATPTKKATSICRYEFVGWDKDYRKITQDTDITAIFKAIEINQGGNDGNGEAKPPTVVEPSTSDSINNYLGSSGKSPQTADSLPIELLAVILLVSAGGIIVIKKKSKIYK